MEDTNKLLKNLGLKPETLPGFIIVLVVYTIALEIAKDPLLSSTQIQLSEPASQSLLVIISFIISLISYNLSGRLIDPVYDLFYGERFGIWENSTSSPLFLFPRGYDLKSCRRKTRKFLIEKDPSYDKKDDRGRYLEGIYRKVMEEFKVENPEIYRALLDEVAWSKTARNSIIPLFILGVLVAFFKIWMLFLLLIALCFLLMIPVFSLRNSHQVSMYEKFNSKHSA